MYTQQHTVDVEGLKEWVKESEFLFASSTRERKKLMVSINGVYRVYVNGELQDSFDDPQKAVDAFNDIVSEYREQFEF